MSRGKAAQPASVPTGWQDVILVCGKCGKGLDGGFGPKGGDSLARGLKQALRDGKLRQSVQVIETKCMGLCPHGAVTLLHGSQPGSFTAVPPGADLEALLTKMQVLSRLSN